MDFLARVQEKKIPRLKWDQKGKKELSRSRLELETVCVLDRRDNHLHQRDL